MAPDSFCLANIDTPASLENPGVRTRLKDGLQFQWGHFSNAELTSSINPSQTTGHKFEAKLEQCGVTGFEGTWDTEVEARLGLAGRTRHGLMVAMCYRHWSHKDTHP
jgi:hypothetical protein